MPVEPDYPVNFGRKCSWLAIQSEKPEEVVQALHLTEVQVSGWKTGLDAAYETWKPSSKHGLCFVSPPVKGWVLAVCHSLPYPGDYRHADKATPFLLKLGQKFPDVQYFATHRVSSYAVWARLINGQVVRKLGWGDLELLWNEGAPTAEEVALNLTYSEYIARATNPTSEDWNDDDDWDEDDDDTPFPGDEDDVLRLAGAWSIDPSTLTEQNLPPGTGYLGRLPE
jgi:hypothetical protein